MIHPHAAAALTAARNWKAWGRYAATAYAIKRGCPLSLLRLARQLEALAK
jgi:hypothetical protein